MRAAIDVSTVLNHGTGIGSSRYILNLVKNILDIDSHNTYVLFGRHITDNNIAIFEDIRKEYAAANLELKFFPTTKKALARWDRFLMPPLDLSGLRADIYHFPDYLLAPLVSRNIALTIHDLSFYAVPQFNFEWFVKKYQKIVARNAKKAKVIIADSYSTKKDIMNYLNIHTDKIEVIHLGVDRCFRKLEQDKIDENVLKKFNIDKKFILSVGTIEPRKNYVNLLKAFDIIRQKEDVCCVICGLVGWKSEDIFAQKEKSPYGSDIKFIGGVTNEELLQLYNQAELLFYPSYFEGFGLPVVEAMACGLPVVASDTSSIVELVEDKSLLFSPEDIGGFSDKILDIISDVKLKEALSIKVLENAKKFNFKKTAQKTIDTYLKLLK